MSKNCKRICWFSTILVLMGLLIVLVRWFFRRRGELWSGEALESAAELPGEVGIDNII